MSVEQITILLPFVEMFRNRSNIDDLLQTLNRISCGQIKFYEFGFDGINFLVVFYSKRKPTRDTIEFLVRNHPDIENEAINYWYWG